MKLGTILCILFLPSGSKLVQDLVYDCRQHFCGVLFTFACPAQGLFSASSSAADSIPKDAPIPIMLAIYQNYLNSSDHVFGSLIFLMLCH